MMSGGRVGGWCLGWVVSKPLADQQRQKDFADLPLIMSM
jgi:hypothetical protein